MGRAEARYDVGGVMLPQPFKIRRLGHFALSCARVSETVQFYRRVLGFKVSDAIDYRDRPRLAEMLRGVEDSRGYFMRYATDHHALVLFSHEAGRRMRADMRDKVNLDSTVHHVPFECGSLAEIVAGERYFRDRGVTVINSGRYMPGSNWHTYIAAPDGHMAELYYGLEQIGWDGRPKPASMFDGRTTTLPDKPQSTEETEVRDAIARGIDLTAGRRDEDDLLPRYNVDGTLLPRPFKITDLGLVKLFVPDVDAAESFYTQMLGLALTERVDVSGHRCVFLRAGGEHHSLALLPVALRDKLFPGAKTTLCSLGLAVANYRQLCNAAAFLREQGAKLIEMPAELSPGVDYSLHLLDPEGNCIQLYYYMERVGWDGKPQPRDRRVPISPDEWPQTIEPRADTFAGPIFHGPYA